MKKKYKISLIIIGIMLLFVTAIGTGYGVWVSTKKNNEKSSTTLNCFKVYFSDNGIIEMKNITPVVNEEGMETSPYTLTITNICEDTKELQVRLNTLKESTVDTSALTIVAAGNITTDMTLYDNLPTVKTTEDVIKSKLIGLIKIEPNATIRTNIKLWFDETKSPTIEKEDIFKAKFEFIDTESSIKSTFGEMLVNTQKEETPVYTNTATTNEGLYKIQGDHPRDRKSVV